MNSHLSPSSMTREQFVAAFGGVFEHSPWIAEAAYDAGLSDAQDSAATLHIALAEQFRLAQKKALMGVLRAHPDLAGKLASAKRLTAESTSEQASAGLDALTDDERETFTSLNLRYTTEFGFPFIIAVKGLNKNQILEAFQKRIDNSQETEFETACAQVEKIALLRLKDLLP